MPKWSSSQLMRAFEGVKIKEHILWAEIQITKRFKDKNGRVYEPGDTVTVQKSGLVNLDECPKE